MVIAGSGGYVEGKFFPVVTPAEILIVNSTETTTDIAMSFEKTRECDFKSITFRDPEGKSVGYEVLTPSYGSREAAAWETLWRLTTNPSSIEDLNIDVVHRCWGRPYDTHTDMTPVRKEK